MTHHLGPLLAVGNTSTVHAWGRDRVVKVMLPDTPSRWADREADWTARLYAIGLPVPQVIEVTEVEGRRAIVYERVRGPTMLAQVVARPASAPTHARGLAELQARLHAVPAPPGLTRLRARLAAKIHDAALPGPAHDAALGRLSGLEDGDRVCHGDLHPGNVILSDDRAVVIDWFDVAAGTPLADVARTSLLVRPRRRTGLPAYLPGVSNRLLETFHDAYLDAYATITGQRLDGISDWELPVAAARLSENVERGDLEALVADALTGHPSGRSSAQVVARPVVGDQRVEVLEDHR